MKRYKVGDRVTNSYLGDGTVVETNICGQRNWYSVLWDKTPDVRYNMGTNPCLWWPGLHEKENTK
jgi:hypothetical protein